VRFLWIISSAAAASVVPASAQAPATIQGTWDLTRQTRHGPERSGYLVIRADRDRLVAQIHGRGAIKASGSAAGNSFSFHGTQMLVPYALSGTWSGDRMQGELKVMSVDKHFTGQRRQSN
jgi:hypothetical protein